jgi:hypothetical protein
MKFASLAAIALAAFALPAAAQTSAPEPAAPAAPAAALNLDTPIEVLVADPRSKAVLDKYLPGVDQHPAFGQFKTLSLRAVAPFTQGLISDELLAKIEADLAAIK